MIGRRLKIPVLLVIVFLGLAGVAWFGPLDGGAKLMFHAGAARVAAGYFGGVLLHKLWQRPQCPRIPGTMPILSLILLVILYMPFHIDGIKYAPAFVIMCAMVLAAADARSSRLDRSANSSATSPTRSISPIG